jgi:hypothetical protein
VASSNTSSGSAPPSAPTRGSDPSEARTQGRSALWIGATAPSYSRSACAGLATECHCVHVTADMTNEASYEAAIRADSADDDVGRCSVA